MAAKDPKDFEAVFTALRDILRKHASKLKVTEDTQSRFCLTGGRHPKHKKPMAIALVAIGKNYVSFHHIAVYGCPKLLDGISPELKKRMQGKACFNFASVDEKLFAQLEELVVRAHKMFAAGKLPF